LLDPKKVCTSTSILHLPTKHFCW